jgi:hypothetical protein
MCIPHYASWQVHHMFICTSIMCSSACASHSMHHNISISMRTSPLCMRYSLCFGIQSYVSLVHRSSGLKLFMWANISWTCCIYPSLQVILIATHKQLRATAPYDLTILYCCYGQLTFDFWWWNPWSIIIPLLLFKNKFRNLSKQILENICLLVFLLFIEISFSNHFSTWSPSA